jgi:hypothetical protein
MFVAWIAASTVALTSGVAVGAEVPQARVAKMRVLETSIGMVVFLMVYLLLMNIWFGYAVS